MSRKSAELLGFKTKGTAKVRVQYIGPAPLDDKGKHLMAMNAELRRGTPMRQMIAAADTDMVRTDSINIAADTPAAPAPAAPAVAAAPASPVVAKPIQLASAGAMPQLPQLVTPVSTDKMRGIFVQAGVFADPNNARSARASLSGIGPVQVLPVNGATGTFYRVRVGPLASTDAAVDALAQVHAAGMPDARLIVAQN
jgi:rare lipoprotein A